MKRIKEIRIELIDEDREKTVCPYILTPHNVFADMFIEYPDEIAVFIKTIYHIGEYIEGKEKVRT